MTAWLAMTVASVARMTTGNSAQLGPSRKNGFSSVGTSERTSALSEIVQRQRRKDERKPRILDGSPTETAKIRIKRLGPRYGEKNRPEHEEGNQPMFDQKAKCKGRIEGSQDYRRLYDLSKAKRAHFQEP